MSGPVTGIAQIAVTVQDMDRAVAFYRDVLELTLLMAAPTMAFFDCGGVRLYLACGPGATHAPGGGFVYFRTANMEGQCTLLEERGAHIEKEPHVIARMPQHDVWLMWVKDTEGNLFGLMEERAK